MTINILVVDDDEDKSTLLRGVLTDFGVEASSIVSVRDASSARIALSRRDFDIMLLDVLLPSRLDATPRGDVSLDFLREVIEDGIASPPSYVVAVSAYPEIILEFEKQLNGLATQILHVEAGIDGWRQSLGSLLTHVRACQLSPSSFDLDVCFQTALRSPELQAIVENCGIKWGAAEILGPGLLVQRAVVKWNERELRFACAHANQMGMVAATQLSTLLINRFRPRVLVMTGVCGGIGDGVAHGDIVVADKSWDWQSGKWSGGGQFASAPDQKEATAELVAQSRLVEKDIVELYNEYSGVKPPTIPRLHISPMASGSAVVADPEFHKIFRAQHRKVNAVDMECYGVYFAGITSQKPAPAVLCVKAISDLADATKEDDYQPFCSWLSANFMMKVLARYFTAVT